jgi:SAM-dependent methyltransferase
MPAGESRIHAHNQAQQQYYGGTVKPRMTPRDTPYLRRHVDELVRFGGIRPQDRVLEIGCGMGRYTLLLAGRGFRVEGMDLTPSLLDRLREFDSGRHRIPLYCGDVADPHPELEGQFDVVAGLFMLHHLHDLERSFAGVRRLLKPGGRAVFLEPNAYNILFYIQILLWPNISWKGDKGILRMRPGPVLRAMQAAGLSDRAYQRFGFFPPFLANRPWGPAAERALEKFPPWRTFLPFQLFRAVAR